MAGTFSGHLLQAFNEPKTPSVVTSGSMSFDTRAHGTPVPSFPPVFSPSPAPFFGFGPLPEDSTAAKQIATLQAKLNKKLGPEYVSQRPGPSGGPKLTYAEGWKIINLANEVFGFNGWSSNIVSISTDFLDYSEESKRFNVGVTAIIRVTLRDGAYHEDVGYGMLENSKSKGAALDKCKKEAITDALKRTLRNFGNLLGNCLYDKSYAQEVIKIKVKLDKNDLHRRPEFVERIPNASASAAHGQPLAAEASSIRRNEPCVKVENESHQPETPIAYVPRHLRQEMAAAARTEAPARTVVMPALKVPVEEPASDMIASPTNPSLRVASEPNGLATPIQTPMHAQRLPLLRAPPQPIVATSPLSRMDATSERKVSFAEPKPAPVRAESAGPVPVDGDVVDDEDLFQLSTQDEAFFSAVDLGDGDLGRPIDFEEGLGELSTDVPMHEPEVGIVQNSPAIRSGGESVAGSGGPAKSHIRNDPQVQPTTKSPLSTSGDGDLTSRTSTSGQQPRAQRTSNVAATTSSMHASTSAQDIKRFRPTMTSMGGFHFPQDVKPPVQHTPATKATVSACVRTSQVGSASTLKRNADVMMAVSASTFSTRPHPIQGMGLAQRQQLNANASRSLDHSEVHDSKRLKR